MNRDAAGDCLILGIGRAICGIEGVPGLCLDHRIGMKWLVESGAHNPMTGRVLTLDWAERVLGAGRVSIGLIELAERYLGADIPPGSRSATEWDLIDKAVRDAMREANARFEDIDCIIHVSPTAALPRTAARNIGFQDCLRDFHARFRLRDDCRLYHLQNGCSGVGPALNLARGMVASGMCDTILLVTSVWGGAYRNVPAAAARNDINIWLSGLLFGDAAGAIVLGGSNSGLDRGIGYFEILQQAQHTDPDTWIAAVNPDPAGDYITINPAAAKALFIDKFAETVDKMGLRIADLDRIVIHQPNSNVVAQMNQRFRDVMRVPIVDVANRYGNLVCSSAVVNLFECRIDEKAPPISDRGLVLVFTLGADCGMTYGGALLRYRLA